MAKVNYVHWMIQYVEVRCNCGEHIKVTGNSDWIEEQTEYGEIDVDYSCPFCGSTVKLKCDLEDYSNAIQ